MKYLFEKLVPVNTGRKSSEIQFLVPVKPEPEQGFEIPVPDWPEPECQKIYPVLVARTRIVFGQIKNTFRSYPTLGQYQYDAALLTRNVRFVAHAQNYVVYHKKTSGH